MHSGQRHMKSEGWKTYRTRFLVKSKQLTSGLTFVDHLGRQHSGRKGDYLVESFDGVLSIAPRRIFEDIYVLMSSDEFSGEPTVHTAIGQAQFRETALQQPLIEQPALDFSNFEALAMDQIKLSKSTPLRRRRDDPPAVGGPETNRGRRKLPQPCRVGPSGTRLGLM
jgi:hypothetical protein